VHERLCQPVLVCVHHMLSQLFPLRGETCFTSVETIYSRTVR
jgi:hypothetical protein